MKNSNGFGSIVCLDKTGKKRRKPWGVRITTGWKDGKQVRKYLGFYTTQTEALMALAEYHKNGVDLDLSKLTIDDIYQRWIKRIEQKDLSDSVLRTHRMTYNKMGNLLNKQIKNVKTAHLQTWLDEVEAKPSTKSKMKSTLIQIFDYAATNDIVSKNYATFLEVNGKVEKTGAIFTPGEIKQLWDMKDRFEARLLLIMIYTGMRIGEVLAVKREHINFEEQYITGGNKTKAGKNRVIPIHNDLMDLIKEQLGDGDWLIRNSHGGKVAYSGIHGEHKAFMNEIGQSHKFHDARKTAVSLMHSANIPMETIRVIVGHSGKGVTEKVYLYKNPKELVDIINTMKIL
jgi:integrase